MIMMMIMMMMMIIIITITTKGKGRFVPVLNSAPRHENVLGEWRYSSTESQSRGQTEVSGGQIHAPVALPPGKVAPILIR
jgi:hypothetical protein